MMNSNELLDALKKHSDVPSDYALAKKILKVDVTAIRNMRERGLSEERALQIATLLGLDPGPIMADIHAERSKDPAVRKAWETIAKTIRSAAAAILIVLGMGVTAPEPAQASANCTRYTLCEVRWLRRALAALLTILACSGQVNAADWDATDTKWQTAYLILHAIDHRQTLHIAKNPAYQETNPILGDHPSDSEVNRYFIAAAIVHTAIAYTLPRSWRRGFQLITIGVESSAVAINYSVGVRLDF